MENQFVTYEVALKLKELGFDEPCLSVFARNLNFDLTMFGQRFDNKIETSKDFADDIQLEDVLCPLWQQCIDWFREEYYIHILINLTYKCFNICISKYDEYEDDNEILDIDGLNFKDFITYHEAREQAILKAIELCQKEK